MQAIDLEDFESNDPMRGLHVRFFMHPVQDMAASDEAGRPIFVDTQFIEILAAGNSTNIVVREVRETDKQKFRKVYEQFIAGDGDAISGTPLTEVSWITKSQCEEMRFMKIRTVEQLADLNDNVALNNSGFVTLKQKAKMWLDKSAAAAPFTAMQAENEAMRAELAEMRELLNAKLSKEKPSKEKPTKEQAE